MSQTISSTSNAASAASSTPLTGPIVVAVGGGDPDSVLRAARLLAPASTAGVMAVSVLTPLEVSIPGESRWMIPPDYEEQRYAACTSELTKRVAEVGDVATTWTRKVLRGSPASAIADLAREEKAAMLVVGIGRHRPLDRIFGAETALRTVQHAPCPVLVVHPDVAGAFHDVVIATDFSPASVAAAQAMMPLLNPAATIHIVHVWQPGDAYDPRKEQLDNAYVRSLPLSFRRFTQLLAIPANATVKTVVREGRPAERVLDYAESHHADLVVAGRHGRSLIERLLVGSQTTALVRAAQRSLLIAPEPPLEECERLRQALSFDEGADRGHAAGE